MDYIRECLAANLKIRRAAMRLSQEALAELADLSPGFIANMETGRAWPSPESLAKLSAALNVDHWKLFVDPKKIEFGYSREEVAGFFDRAKNEALGGAFPPPPSSSRYFPGESGKAGGKRR